MRFLLFISLFFVLSLSFAQIRKLELSAESGFQDNVFKSPTLIRQPDSFLHATESDFFLGLSGEFDVRLQWGAPVRRNIQRHQVDLYHTLSTHQFPQLLDASTIWGDVQGSYRYRFSQSLSFLAEGGYTHFHTPEDLKTPDRNIVSFGFRRWEAGTGVEVKGGRNHVSRITVSYRDKDYLYQNSLDRKEYEGRYYARQRFRDAFGRVSYLRWNSNVHYRTYDNTRGTGVDEEGFEVLTGKRRFLQVQTDLSFEYPLRELLRIKPGIQFRYREDIFPNRFDYYHLRPYLDLQLEYGSLEMDVNASYTLRNYKDFNPGEGSSDHLQYQYLILRWEGVYSPKKNSKICPYWRVDWNSRSSSHENLSRLAFRGYESWAVRLGLRMKWE